MTRKPRMASNSTTHRPAHRRRRIPALALRMTSLRRLACPSKAFPLGLATVRFRILFGILRQQCAGSLVDHAAGGKVAESRRLKCRISRRFMPPGSAIPAFPQRFAYASCSSVAVARPASVVHAHEGASAPAVESPIRMSGDLTAKPPATPGIDGLPPELRRWAVAAIFTALALASLDTAIA